MRIIDAEKIARYLPYDQLIDALDEAFRAGAASPERVHYALPAPGSSPATLLLMPAWQAGVALGVKVVTVYPDNVVRSLPAVHASYILMDAETGVPTAVMDGTELTLRRTACASALASRYLSREDASHLLMVGTGNLAPHLILAHATARNLDKVTIWGRRREAAAALASKLSTDAFDLSVADDLQEAVAAADVISCATLSDRPLVEGAWLRPGQHLDLVGAFTPNMCEADVAAVARSEVFVDTYAGAAAEAGDIMQAIAAGRFSSGDIRADLGELAQGRHGGRKAAADITLFKSTGTAIEDLAAAQLVARNSTAGDDQPATGPGTI